MKMLRLQLRRAAVTAKIRLRPDTQRAASQRRADSQLSLNRPTVRI